MKHKTLLFLTISLIFSSAIFAQTPNNVRLQAFEQVWSTVNEKHFDPKFGGVDWKKVGETYKPIALKAKTDDEFHTVLMQMLGELKLSHFAVYPNRVEMNSGEVLGKSGFEIKMFENKPVVNKIVVNSDAQKNGLKMGFELTEIGGKRVTDILKPLEESFAKRSITEQQKRLYREIFLMGLVDGKADSQAEFKFLNARNEEFRLSVNRQKHDAIYSQPMGNFPAQEVVFESKVLENNIGYIHFNMWLIPQMPKIRQAISEMKNVDGIIIDLRGNPGGVGGLANGFAGLLCKEQTSLGTMTSRDSELKFVVYPQKETYGGKIVILTDYGSASTSEVFAAGMQEIGRATIIGETTAGAVLPSVFVNLPTGAIFQYAISDYKSPKRVVIENRGVVPDIEVLQTRQAALENRDLPLETAINLIKKGR